MSATTNLPTTYATRNPESDNVTIRVAYLGIDEEIERENRIDPAADRGFTPGEATIERLVRRLSDRGLLVFGTHKLSEDGLDLTFAVPANVHLAAEVQNCIISGICQEVTGLPVSFGPIPDELLADYSAPPAPKSLPTRIRHWISNTYSDLILQWTAYRYERSVMRRCRSWK